MAKTSTVASKEYLDNQLNSIIEKKEKLEAGFKPDHQEKDIIYAMDTWQEEMEKKLKRIVGTLKKELKDTLKQLDNDFKTSIDTLNLKIDQMKQPNTKLNEQKIREIQDLLGQCETNSKTILTLETPSLDESLVPKIIRGQLGTSAGNPPIIARTDQESKESTENKPASARDRRRNRDTTRDDDQAAAIARPIDPSVSPKSPFSQEFGFRSQTDQAIRSLFDQLRQLPSMNKKAMSGKCEKETDQMENFLKREFGFQNTSGHIVDGVKAFKLSKSIDTLNPEKIIYFPENKTGSFAMSISEIHRWQQSYRVYSPAKIKEITSSFLQKALKGGSTDGEEAFLMKFVIRIAQCPILMEFDAQVIPRGMQEDWPDRIKLVSVTGVDFACRKHDVGDITKYINNWKDVFELDSGTRLPKAPNGRDFIRRAGAPEAKLDGKKLYFDLLTMAKTRLRACDAEKIEIVVETGIGLGIFDGRYLGIDHEVRYYSALAMKKALEEDAPIYRNIKAIIFALPIFGSADDPAVLERSTYQAFVSVFSEKNYSGPIPVLFIDQDMHRLAVYIAQRGYRVSELNPADSHGVFGEYWQNRGPAVEEKLALTTLGLLVQHHLINPNVLDPKRYRQI